MAKKKGWEPFLDVVKISSDLVGCTFSFIYTFGASYVKKVVVGGRDAMTGCRYGTDEDGNEDRTLIVVPIDPIGLTGDPFYHRSIHVRRTFEIDDPDFGTRVKTIDEDIKPSIDQTVTSTIVQGAIRGQSGRVAFADLNAEQREQLIAPLTEKVNAAVERVESMTLSMDLETGELILEQTK